jgi:hypothetical protein
VKHKYLLLIITGLTIGLVACKKDNKYPIVGKWQETKLRIYIKSYSGAISGDTTYLNPFTNLDYVQFNNNGTCVIASDHIYYPGAASLPKIPTVYLSAETLNFTLVGSAYILTIQNTLSNPGGFTTTDTVSVSNNTLLIHSVFDGHIAYTVSDAYYTK